ncbi:MAG: hypothetical protein AAFY90_14610, partial [Pseudomonadota bacterium]
VRVRGNPVSPNSAVSIGGAAGAVVWCRAEGDFRIPRRIDLPTAPIFRDIATMCIGSGEGF